VENNFPESFRKHLGAVNSDHCPLLIDTLPSDIMLPNHSVLRPCGQRILDVMVLLVKPGKKSLLAMSASSCARKQFHTITALKKWNREVFGHCQSKISEISKQIELIQCEAPTRWRTVLRKQSCSLI
jgi:hypothetical protein